jgi:DNA invertase Pin-like site-specific DNA recombinase
MTTELFAVGNRTRSITTLAALTVATLLLAGPTSAHAASGRPAQMVAQGAGMGAQPSAQVHQVQQALDRRGYDLGRPGVDGRFGPLTDVAVRRMQADYGLAVDGIVGAHTRHALRLSPLVTASRGSQTTSHRKPTQTRPKSSGDRRQRVTDTTSATSRDHSSARAGAAATVRRSTQMQLASSSHQTLPLVAGGALAGMTATLLVLWITSARRRRRAQPVTSIPYQTLSANGAAPTRAASAPPRKAMNGVASDSESPGPAVIPRSRLGAGHSVIGYVTVPTMLGSSRDGASSAAIEAACEGAGWKLLEIVRDGDRGRPLERPGLRYALQRIADREARGLVVDDLQRLGRSVVNIGALMAWFRDAGATLIALDVGLDTSTPEGRHVATTLITMSVRDQERIATRTRDGLAEVRANGRTAGRPAVSDRPELLQRIAEMRAAKMTLQAIADELNAEGVPTLRGGAKWRPSSIQAALGYRRPNGRDHMPIPEARARP